MQNSKSNHSQPEPPIFVCRHEDGNPLFGSLVLGALSEQLGADSRVAGRTGSLIDKMAGYFPEGTFRKIPALSPLEVYSGKEPYPYLQVQLIPCDNHPVPLDEKYFRHLGYMIDPEQQQFNVLRGSITEHATSELCKRFDDAQKEYIRAGTWLDNHIYFPYRIEKTYGFDSLPTTMQFLDDMYSSR